MKVTIDIPDQFSAEAIAVNAARYKKTRMQALRNAALPETEVEMTDEEVVAKGVVSELLIHVRNHRTQQAAANFDAQLNALAADDKKALD
jgi:hypothetical protein